MMEMIVRLHCKLPCHQHQYYAHHLRRSRNRQLKYSLFIQFTAMKHEHPSMFRVQIPCGPGFLFGLDTTSFQLSHIITHFGGLFNFLCFRLSLSSSLSSSSFFVRLLCNQMFVQLADYRTSYYYCSSQPLGIENKAIPDSAFNFSHSPQGYPGHFASVRLASDGGWCPLASKDSFVFLRVSFQAIHIICAIGLQGDAKNIGFVSKYKLKLAIEDSGEEFYRERGEIKVSALIEGKLSTLSERGLKRALKTLNFLELAFRQLTVLRA